MTKGQSIPELYRRIALVVGVFIFIALKEFSGLALLSRIDNWALSVMALFALIGICSCSIQVADFLANRHIGKAQDV